ncbi:hypothetical protein J5N97_013337 [Dioscorea zingiberensis]|uniref:Heat shock 70 kDa protein 14 n=1 Tax=Dioscorea zingiberensis TaxID=325984 RepID=A0A9D5CR19_9LILI|nr:hypothetical protein J5N97_013337 [Dioscorea zingiberensis]
MSVVGFDLGNENCLVAVARQRGIDVVLNDESKRRRRPPLFVLIKRLIGKKFSDPEIQSDIKTLPFLVTEGPDGFPLIHARYLGEQRAFTPTQLLAMVLSNLKSIAEKNLNIAVVDCCIGIPVYFTDLQRRAVIDAATIAGLHPLRLFHETTATALAYGIYKTDLPENDQINVAFIDIGHADMQVCVAGFKKGQLKILSHAYDRSLGGRDFDEVLFKHFAAKFKEEYKIDVYQNARACLRLRAACEKLKKVLSANPEAPLNIECLMDEKDVNDSFPFSIALSWKGSASDSQNGAADNQQRTLVFPKGNPVPSTKSSYLFRTGTFSVDVIYSEVNDLQVPAQISTYTMLEEEEIEVPVSAAKEPQKEAVKMDTDETTNVSSSGGSDVNMQDDKNTSESSGDGTENGAPGVQMDTDAKAEAPKKKVKKTNVPVTELVYGGMLAADLQKAVEKEFEMALQDRVMEETKDKKNAVEVINECTAADAWLREKKQQQEACSKQTTPVLLSADVKRKAETLDRLCRPIMTKPKPPPAKPQTSPPTETPAPQSQASDEQQPKVDTEMGDQTTDADAQATAPSSDEPMETDKPEDANPTA